MYSFVVYQVLQKLTLVVEYSHREKTTVLKTRSFVSGREPTIDLKLLTVDL